jgi:hypothetical protein
LPGGSNELPGGPNDSPGGPNELPGGPNELPGRSNEWVGGSTHWVERSGDSVERSGMSFPRYPHGDGGLYPGPGWSPDELEGFPHVFEPSGSTNRRSGSANGHSGGWFSGAGCRGRDATRSFGRRPRLKRKFEETHNESGRFETLLNDHKGDDDETTVATGATTHPEESRSKQINMSTPRNQMRMRRRLPPRNEYRPEACVHGGSQPARRNQARTSPPSSRCCRSIPEHMHTHQ